VLSRVALRANLSVMNSGFIIFVQSYSIWWTRHIFSAIVWKPRRTLLGARGLPALLTSKILISGTSSHYQVLETSAALNVEREVDLLLSAKTEAGVILQWVRNLLVNFARGLFILHLAVYGHQEASESPIERSHRP
jgi:hypothetical protein